MKSTEKEVQQFQEMWNIPGINERIIKQFSSFGGNPEIAMLGTVTSQKQLFEKKQYPCYKPWKNFTITWDGKVVPCCYDYNKLYVLGDLHEQTLEEIWHGSRMRELRQQHVNGQFGNNTLCGECLEKFGCPGFNEPVALTGFLAKKIARRDFAALRRGD